MTTLSRPRLPWRRLALALVLALLAAALNLLAWRLVQPPVDLPDAPPRLAGLAYNAFQRHGSPLEGSFPSEAEVEADLARLAPLTGRLRTYSSSELPFLPGLAARHGLRLHAGVWLDGREAHNERELAAAIEAVRQHPNIERVIVGNETLLTAKLKPEQLHAHLDRMRAALDVPVSTAEPWHVWLKQPQLAEHVDFITVHLLPYWEGVPAAQAIDHALDRLAEVQARFPGRKVVVGEVGWPSGGDRFAGARATPGEQAAFLRGFLDRIRGRGLEYFVMEAVDQPWKRAIEGRVGAYWGLLDAQRQPKFPLHGPLQADRFDARKAWGASALGLVLVLGCLSRLRRWRWPARLGFALAAQAVVSLTVLLATLPLKHYLEHLDWGVMVLLSPALALMTATLLVQLFEFSELFFEGNLRRRFGPRAWPAGRPPPRVSIHLACCNEPPAMVIATLESLRALDWPDFEVLVVDNNTRDEALWRPVEAHCARLAQALDAEGRGRLRFFHLPSWPGFKAGALNFALAQTDPAAEVVAVVDADYLVRADWLATLMGHFAEPQVAVVQAPQAHRDWARHPFRRMMNWEYEGFFRIGMHHRNERDAIIQHGTMTLVRAAALREGGWTESCICEDSELGLRLMGRGLRTVYVDRVVGEGLTPDGFAAFRKQRRRWAQGAMQILRRHHRALLGLAPRPGEAPMRLSPAQRYHFVAGWLPWIGDAVQLLLAFATLAWTIGLLAAPQHFSLPAMLFLGPLSGLLSVRLLIGPVLYRRRVPCSWGETAGAALAGLGLAHAIARGVLAGLFEGRAVFEITTKGQAGRPAGTRRVFGAVREEAGLLFTFILAMAAVAWARPRDHAESLLWLAVLAVQAVPYAAAVACELLSRRPEAPAGQEAARGRGGVPEVQASA